MMYHALINGIRYCAHECSPFILSNDVLATQWPFFGFLGTKMMAMIIMLLGMLMLSLIIDKLLYHKQYIIAGVFILLSGFMIHNLSSALPMSWWVLLCLATSLFFGLLYWFLLSRDRSYGPFIVGSSYIIAILYQAVVNPLPGALSYVVMGSIVVIIIMGICFFLLHKQQLTE